MSVKRLYSEKCSVNQIIIIFFLKTLKTALFKK